MRDGAAISWERNAQRDDGVWVWARSADGVTVVAVNEASPTGQRRRVEAVVYPELHSRAVSWWLIHAWRLLDLVDDTVASLDAWRVTSAAVTARAALEEVGCVLDETVALAKAWQAAKLPGDDALTRAAEVRKQLHPVLVQASFGTRMQDGRPDARAKSVLTYIQKLEKWTQRSVATTDWYDWLSDAAHPAFGARIALASQPIVHETRAFTLRFLARRPVPIISPIGVFTDFTIAHMAADAVTFAAEAGKQLLECALNVVDDFGLTTGAAELTNRAYWRNSLPERGRAPCPCGCGPAAKSRHNWHSPAPESPQWSRP